MGNAVRVSKGHPAVKALLAVAFPEYKGRKVYVELAEKAYVEPCAEGGSFDKVVAVNLAGEKLAVSFGWADQWKYSAEPFPVPVGIALVVHSYFCGKDMGISIYVNPASAAALPAHVAGLLPAGKEAA
jgi:hypothetical protein